MADVRIYQPSKNAMQSGRFGRQYWVMEFETACAQHFEPLMHWISSEDTREQVHLKFPSKEEAIVFAKKKHLTYDIEEPNRKTIKPKNYSDNFIVR